MDAGGAIGRSGLPTPFPTGSAAVGKEARTGPGKPAPAVSAGAIDSGDSLHISEAARSALEVSTFAGMVKSMPGIRAGVIEGVSEMLGNGAWQTVAAYNGAAQAMLAAGAF